MLATLVSCTSSDATNQALCEVFDKTAVEQEFGLPVVDKGAQGIEFSSTASDVGQDSGWRCQVSMPDPVKLKLVDAMNRDFIAPDFDDAPMSAGDAPVSLGNGIDGAVMRQHRTSPGRPPDGYVAFDCERGRIKGSGPFGVIAFDRHLGTATAPTARDLGKLLTMAANGVRKRFGCEGKPFPLPDMPEDPSHKSLAAVDRACATFSTAHLRDLLAGAKDSSAEWREWQSPTDGSPVASCQVWREARSSEMGSSTATPALFGPMIAFNRYADTAAKILDPDGDGFVTEHAWPNDLDGKGFVAEPRNRVTETAYRVRRSCRGDTHIYTGGFAAGTVNRSDFEDLFDQWIRAHAKRDGCPVAVTR